MPRSNTPLNVKGGSKSKSTGRSGTSRGTSVPARTNRERIVEAAWDLFWLKGFYATSVADIAVQARLPKGSIYNYFESKEQLLVHVLGRLKYQIETELRLKVLQGTLSPSDIVARLLDHYSELYSKLSYGRGDPLSGRLSELADTNPELIAQLRPLQSAWLAVITQKIWAYATVSHIPVLVDKAESLAGIIWAALQGVLIQMKVARSADPLEDARRTLVPMIASYVSALASGDVLS